VTRPVRIASVGSALPERLVTNDELSTMVDTSDEWIVARTGIRARRFAGGEESASGMAATAASAALEAAAVDPAGVDLLVVATVSGDRPLPSTASFVQAHLGMRGAAFDLAAGCAGFVYGLSVASSMVASGAAETALVVGTEVLSRLLNFEDRSTCVLFGDGAGAALLLPSDEPGLLGTVLDNDGSHADLLTIPAGGSARPATAEAIANHEHLIHMADGREVYRRAVLAIAEDVTWLVPHQANVRIIRGVADRLNFPMDRVWVDLEHVGNTSAASVPIALDHAWRTGALKPGDLVMTVAFGAGLAWGANLIRWTAEAPR
jgi:3-oxoacyl-[acyl-carrier-protein] synthase-3